MRYLSDEWIRAVADEVAADAKLQALAASHVVSVVQNVTGTPFGDVTYHLICRDAAVTFAGGSVPADVVFTQDYTTAVDVALGRLNAAEAFINGKVRFTGDHERVVAAQPLFAALDGAFTRVRERTTFD